MSLEKTVIDNIKRIRKERGLSQEKLAEFCDTSASYIGLMETYKNIPKLSTIEKIAEALNVDPLVLFSNSGDGGNENGGDALSRDKNISDQTKERLKIQIMQNLDKTLDEVFMQI